MNYARDREAIRQAVLVRDGERCVNCRTSGDGVTLDVHHIVPRGHGGSNRLSNLALLCRRCHEAAHGREMAPVVKFHTNGSMTADEFGKCLEYWRQHPLARFHDGDDEDNRYWYIPMADVELVVNEFAS